MDLCSNLIKWVRSLPNELYTFNIIVGLHQ